MPTRCSGSIALLSAFVVIASVGHARAATPARAAGQLTRYFVCVEKVLTNGGKSVTDYFSDVVSFTKVPPGPLDATFADFVAAKYGVKGSPACVQVASEQDGRQQLAKMQSPDRKAVLTGWKYDPAAANAPAPAPAPPAAPRGRGKGDNVSSGPPADVQLFLFCWEIAADYTVYITKVVAHPTPLAQIQRIPAEYSDFIAARYGVKTSASCPASRFSQAELEAQRTREIAQIRRGSPKARFVEVDWTPKPQDAPPAPGRGATNPAPAAPAPNALDAYNKALAAQRPASNTGAAAPAPVAAAAKPPAPAVETFSYCYAYGTPQGPGNGKPRRQHFYVTPIFARTAADQPGGDWQKFIRAAHTDEGFNASCSAPQPRAAVEKARTDQVASMRKLANFDVVDVDWKR